MIEVALQIVLNLCIALVIGIFIGYFIGKNRSSKIIEKDEKIEIKKPTKDNLKKIKGINSQLEIELNKMGIDSFKQISLWSKEDCVTIGATINAESSIEEFSWVEQAKILASGEETIYSQKVENKEIEVA